MHPTPPRQTLPASRHPVVPVAAATAQESRWLGTAWGVTLPASFESAAPSEPFKEPLRGMAVREVKEPEVFRLFFGHKVRAY